MSHFYEINNSQRYEPRRLKVWSRSGKHSAPDSPQVVREVDASSFDWHTSQRASWKSEPRSCRPTYLTEYMPSLGIGLATYFRLPPKTLSVVGSFGNLHLGYSLNGTTNNEAVNKVFEVHMSLYFATTCKLTWKGAILCTSGCSLWMCTNSLTQALTVGLCLTLVNQQ